MKLARDMHCPRRSRAANGSLSRTVLMASWNCSTWNRWKSSKPGCTKSWKPRADLRDVESKRVDVKELDLILVPGVGFDARGGRTGHGKGYYDKLLENAQLSTPLIALAFECQMFDEIPMQSHDIFMDKVVTEAKVYDGIGRKDA